jgi:hypothetical protein
MANSNIPNIAFWFVVWQELDPQRVSDWLASQGLTIAAINDEKGVPRQRAVFTDRGGLGMGPIAAVPLRAPPSNQMQVEHDVVC